MNLRALIATDNEGCLTDGKYLPVNLEQTNQVRTFLSQHPDVGFLISTGRPVPYVEAMMQMVGQQDSPIPCICEGGGVLYTPRSDRTELLTDPIDPMPLRTALNGAAFREEPGKITCYSVYPEEPDTIPTLHDRILLTGLSDRFNITVSSAAVDVTPKGIDKGSALRIVAERLGVGLDRVMAFGDSANDVAMLKVAGFSACPSNASEAARKASRYKSLHPSTLGLIDAMKHFIDTL